MFPVDTDSVSGATMQRLLRWAMARFAPIAEMNTQLQVWKEKYAWPQYASVRYRTQGQQSFNLSLTPDVGSAAW